MIDKYQMCIVYIDDPWLRSLNENDIQFVGMQITKMFCVSLALQVYPRHVQSPLSLKLIEH